MGMAKFRPPGARNPWTISRRNLEYIVNYVADMTTHANPCSAATTWVVWVNTCYRFWLVDLFIFTVYLGSRPTVIFGAQRSTEAESEKDLLCDLIWLSWKLVLIKPRLSKRTRSNIIGSSAETEFRFRLATNQLAHAAVVAFVTVR